MQLLQHVQPPSDNFQMVRRVVHHRHAYATGRAKRRLHGAMAGRMASMRRGMRLLHMGGTRLTGWGVPRLLDNMRRMGRG